MDLQSYIQLKEAYVNLNAPQVELTEEEVWVEVEAFAQALVEEEGLDLSDMTWDEVREAYLDEGIANDPRWGPIGQVARLGKKMFGNKEQGDSAREYETSVNNINRRRNQNPSTSTATANEIEAETKGRKSQTSSSSSANSGNSGNKPADNKPAYKGPGGNPNGSGEGQAQQRSTGTGARSASSSSSSKPVQKAAPAKDRMANASKADRMSAWAKANPKLAAAQKQRASTRGTSASTNPLMKDFKSRMPKPAAPAKATPAKSPSLTGNKASSSMSSGGSKAAASSSSGPKFNPAASRIAMGGNKATAPKTAVKKVAEEVDVFDVILTHLIEQGFSDGEALELMTSMSEEKRQQMLSLISEEESDALKDRRQERGGVDGNTDYSRAAKSAPKGEKKGKTPLQKDAEEKYGKGASAMDIVRAKIKAQYGDKAIKDTKKD